MRRENPTLQRCPRAELAAAGAACEIGVALGVAHALDGAFDADLFFAFRPVETERRDGLPVELVTLAAMSVRIENEAARVERLEEDDARARAAVRVDRREGHRRGLELAARLRSRERIAEERDRIGRHALLAFALPR